MSRGQLFNHVKLHKPKTNGFNMNYQLLTTGNMGDLIPITCQEVIPGDVWRGRSEIFCRLMPMLRPIMQRVDIYTHYFFVPNRLLWNISKQKNSWQAFITGGEDGKQTPEPPNFYMSKENLLAVKDSMQGAFDVCSLWDYFNLPTITDTDLQTSLQSGQSVGSNEKTVHLTGINVPGVKVSVFMMSIIVTKIIQSQFLILKICKVEVIQLLRWLICLLFVKGHGKKIILLQLCQVLNEVSQLSFHY